MSGAVAWVLVALGLGVVGARRRSLAVALVTLQALVLVGVGLAEAAAADELVAVGALAARACVLGAGFLLLVARTREPRPLRAGIGPLARAGIVVALVLAFVWLVPPVGLESRAAEVAVLALVACGMVTVATRRATVFQILGVVLVENGLALAALALPGVSSLAIELGVALDLMLVVLVAAVFHERIFAAFGAGDSAALRSLRD